MTRRIKSQHGWQGIRSYGWDEERMRRKFGLGMLATQKRKSRPDPVRWKRKRLIGSSPYVVGTIPAPIFNLKVKSLQNHSIAVVFSAKATPGGELHIPTQPKPGSTAREFETASVRVCCHPWSMIGCLFRKLWFWLAVEAYNRAVLGYLLDRIPKLDLLHHAAKVSPWKWNSVQVICKRPHQCTHWFWLGITFPRCCFGGV